MKRRVYILKEACEDGQYVSATDLVDSPKKALHHASRLAARQYSIKRFGNKQAAEMYVVPIDLEPEPVRLPPPKMLLTDPVEIAMAIWPIHTQACEQVEDWLRKVGVEESTIVAPRALATSRPQPWSGLYTPDDHTCHYSLACASLTLGSGDEHDFTSIILHEVAHAYQRPLIGPGVPLGHGGDWFVIMRRALAVAEPKVKSTGYDWPKVIGAAKFMRRAAEKAAKSGLLASLPISVITESIKRKGMQ